jgi:hypothetical protein
MLGRVDWNPDRAQMRKFGVASLIGFCALGGFLQWRIGRSDWLPFFICAGIGATMLLGAFLFPRGAGLYIYRAWMGFGVALGWVMGPIMISIVFFGVITPIGLLMRLLGHDPLRLKKGKGDSFWVKLDHRTDRRHYERQF